MHDKLSSSYVIKGYKPPLPFNDDANDHDNIWLVSALTTIWICYQVACNCWRRTRNPHRGSPCGQSGDVVPLFSVSEYLNAALKLTSNMTARRRRCYIWKRESVKDRNIPDEQW